MEVWSSRDKLERQMRKYKTKINRKSHVKKVFDMQSPSWRVFTRRKSWRWSWKWNIEIVRTKRLSLNQWIVEEAVYK